MHYFRPSNFFDLSQFAHKALFQDCAFAWEALARLKGYLALQKLGKIEAAKQEYAYLVNPELITIGAGTIIEPGAYIKGPCIIGKDCHIRHGAYIRGDVIIGDRCVVGHTTELKHAILLNDAHAAHFAYVADSIVGNHVNLGAGTKCANLRLDGEPVIVRHDAESFSTGMRKFGSLLGDFAQIGCNVVLNPGTVVGKHVHSFPQLSISGVIPEKAIIKAPGKSQIFV
jgi:NDP-sugar pyrophosphorylase family protein